MVDKFKIKSTGIDPNTKRLRRYPKYYFISIRSYLWLHNYYDFIGGRVQGYCLWWSFWNKFVPVVMINLLEIEYSLLIYYNLPNTVIYTYTHIYIYIYILFIFRLNPLNYKFEYLIIIFLSPTYISLNMNFLIAYHYK